MNNKDIVKIAAVVILAPMAIGSIVTMGTHAVVGVTNGISKISFKNRIKKGLKDGSIVEIDGRYYEIETTEEA